MTAGYKAQGIHYLALGAAVFLSLASTVLAGNDVLLVRSNPRDGARLKRSPAEIEMLFKGLLALRGHRIRILRTDGSVVTSGRPGAAADFTTLYMPVLKPLREGHYTVIWSVQTDTGTKSSGRFSFAIEKQQFNQKP